jgi:hypothetical protein
VRKGHRYYKETTTVSVVLLSLLRYLARWVRREGDVCLLRDSCQLPLTEELARVRASVLQEAEAAGSKLGAWHADAWGL